MRYTKLEQPINLAELDPKCAQMIFKAKLEMFDVEINFKGLYPLYLLCPFCNVVNEDFSHMFNCKFGPVRPASVSLSLRLEYLKSVHSVLTHVAYKRSVRKWKRKINIEKIDIYCFSHFGDSTTEIKLNWLPMTPFLLYICMVSG